MFKHDVESALAKVLTQLGASGITSDVEYQADPTHGDFITNVAFAF